MFAQHSPEGDGCSQRAPIGLFEEATRLPNDFALALAKVLKGTQFQHFFHIFPNLFTSFTFFHPLHKSKMFQDVPRCSKCRVGPRWIQGGTPRSSRVWSTTGLEIPRRCGAFDRHQRLSDAVAVSLSLKHVLKRFEEGRTYHWRKRYAKLGEELKEL